jgi:nucleoside-diphosphate-sugar epimerase
MKNDLHIVLGGSGAIGSAVIKELKKRGIKVKAVTRTKEVEGVGTIHADLLNPVELSQATAGATHIYLCIGLPYDSQVWQRDWPLVMHNTVEVCKAMRARLIFFDNVYMYGPAPLEIPFTEDHRQMPETQKGKTRKATADMLLSALKSKTIRGVIGRSADFYGPRATNSPFYIVFLENMLKNKNPQWLGRPSVKHSYAYTEDNAQALVDLALNEKCYGQVWHMPAGEPITIEDVLKIFNKNLSSKYAISYMPRFMLNMLSLFVPVLKEAREMLYQFDDPYLMSSQKFLQAFPKFKVTPYEAGIRKMIDSFT